MTIIVENGSIVPNANSYITVSGVDSYCSAMGYDAWTTTSSGIKEQSLLKAMRYIDGLRWKGIKYTQDQYTSWPRDDVYDVDERLVPYTVIPIKVIEAVCEACVLSLPTSEFNLEPTITKDDYKTSEAVASVVSNTYVVTDDTIRSKSTIIESKLRGLLKNKIIITIERA